MEKTAMQELKQWLIDKWSDPGKLISCSEVCDKIDELLPLERQQIEQAVIYCYSDVMPHEAAELSAIEYYEENYGEEAEPHA